jgi:hypothetical protein
MVAGGFGGFVFELLNLQGNIERPHAPSEDDLAAKFAYADSENVIDLGVGRGSLLGCLLLLLLYFFCNQRRLLL